MVFRGVISSPRSLLPSQALDLANIYLENAGKVTDSEIALVLCHDTEVSLSQAKKTADQSVIDGVAATYSGLGKQLKELGRDSEAQAIYRKAEKLGWSAQDMDQSSNSSRPAITTRSHRGTFSSAIRPNTLRSFSLGRINTRRTFTTFPMHIFAKNVHPPTYEFKLPEPDERLNTTRQLACCLNLLKASPADIMVPSAHRWLQSIRKDTDEQDRLKKTVTEVIRAFKRDEIKDAKVVAEVVSLVPVLNKDTFHDLLNALCTGIHNSVLLDSHQLDGLAQLMHRADRGYLDSDDLVKILDMLSKRLKDTHNQSTNNMHELTVAVSRVLDAMADTNVKGLDRQKLHEPLTQYLNGLKSSSDPYLVFQAAYASQALLCVPDNETPWQAALRRTAKVVQGVSGLVSAVKGVDLNKFLAGLDDINKGLSGTSKVVEILANAYKDAVELSESGHGFLKCLKEGLSFKSKRDWYAALRGADALIQDGELSSFRKLVCEASCRLDPAFQWGVCQRLGEIAASPMWEVDTRHEAIAFLGEIYRNDEMWGQHVSVKQLVLNTLMQLSVPSEDGLRLDTAFAEAMLRELEADIDAKKELYRMCREGNVVSYPLKVDELDLASPSLLDRAQNRTDVEGSLRLLRKQRVKDRGNAVYIPPQAKPTIQSPDGTQFPLMEKVNAFLGSDQKVFLLVGDSGSGKSTFNRELEFNLWNTYKNKADPIPLHINLPAIDKPEYDMIAKQLRKSEFSEPQIRELKFNHKFILICDGYDESQQTHNLYMSNRLNQPGEWDAKMVISCRSEYLGSDYRDRFQPGDRNRVSDLLQFQEAALTPFTNDQIQAYIRQYVLSHQPLWRTEDYQQALNLIPSLKDLVKNPFLMSLSLEVLPRMMDPGHHLSAAQVTRVALYDHFVEQWFERSKKRLGEKDLSPQYRTVFENLSNEGFSKIGIEFLKDLAVAIYRNQGGHPIVQYSRALKDDGSWKSEFFGRDKEKHLLREACPFSRNGNQYRFMHRSLLEYGLSLAIYDPRRRRIDSALEPKKYRRESALSFQMDHELTEEIVPSELEPNIKSSLVWRNLVDDQSLLHFLEERVQQEPVFKKQLYAYIEHSKKDKKWRRAAANAITILVRAGERFIETDLQGIQIPGADLSYGVFDSVQLQDADLRMVNLRGVWMRKTDLSNAQMTGVQFGELPLIPQVDIVRSCAYSPDGESFAIGLFNGSIAVYSTSNWEVTQTWSGHSGSVRSIVFSPNGELIASCSVDKTIRLWDVENAECLYTLTDHTECVYSVAYSPEGDVLASASGDRTIRLWDSGTTECRQILSGHTADVSCIAYSQDGSQLASGSHDRTVRLWNAGTGDCIAILSGHDDLVWAVAYSPRGNQLASAGEDKTVRLWDLAAGTCNHTMTGHGSTIYTLAYSLGGYEVVSGSVDGTIRMWDVEAGTCSHTFTGHRNTVFGLAYSPRGGELASCSYDKTVRLWDVSVAASRTASGGHSKVVNAVKCSPNRDTIVSCGDHTIRLWDAETGHCRGTLVGHTGVVQSVAFSPQGNQVVSGSGDKSLRLWDVETGASQQIFTGHDRLIRGVAFSPRGHQIASCSNDKTVRLWDVATGDCTGVLNGHTKEVICVAYSPNGKYVASGGNDYEVRIWDTRSLTCRFILEGHKGWITSIEFSSDGQQLISTSGDKTIRLWDVRSGECITTLTGHSKDTLCATFSPNGEMIAVSDYEGTVRLWDVASGQCTTVVESLPGPIRGVCWRATPDANYIATGSDDGSVLMWKIIEDEDQYRTSLDWSSTSGSLCVKDAYLEGTHGLTRVNKQLLKQRGSRGEPEDILYGATKRLMAMASVVSRFKWPLDQTGAEPPVPTTPSKEQQDSP